MKVTSMSSLKQTNSDDVISIDKQVLIKQAFTIAGELLDSHNVNINIGDEEYKNMPNIYELEDYVEHIDKYPGNSVEEYSIHFHGETESHRSKLVSSGSHWHPAEYETIHMKLAFTLIYYPAANGGFGGVELTIDHL